MGRGQEQALELDNDLGNLPETSPPPSPGTTHPAPTHTHTQVHSVSGRQGGLPGQADFPQGGPGISSTQPWQDRALLNSHPYLAHGQAPRGALGSILFPKWNLLSWLLSLFFLIRK